jgi:DNA-binding LytR/AlgR family response regulator
MRVLIVDDEPLARLSLERVLARRPDVEQFEAVASAQHALDRLESQPYDLMLLDIHMPGMSGIELIERLSKLSGPMPSIVFVTAHEEHAIEAFEKRVVDYVLKPFAPARVHEALDTAMRRSAHERAEQLLHALHELREHAPKSDTIAIKDKDRVVFVNATEIISAEAQGNYVVLQQKTGSYLHRGTISGIAARLEPYGFIRIHRSVLINRAFVATIHPGVGHDYILRTKTGAEYHVSSTYRDNLKALAQCWIGPKDFGPNKRRRRIVRD